jgi:lipoyl(octanoyl) transferase
VRYHGGMSANPASLADDRPTPAPTRRAAWLDLGVCEYERAHELQLRLHARRLAGSIADVAIVLEHTPCITYGRAAHAAENILAGEERLSSAGVAVCATDRGGDVTYHGPGQLILYAIVDLAAYGKDVHAHSRRLEQVLIDALASFGVEATRKKEYPGVWTGRGKIGAIGLRVSRWVTLHGISFNVSPDMSHFSLIVPCGIRDHRVTSLAELLGHSIGVAEVKPRVRESFERVFEVSLDDVSAEELGLQEPGEK